MNQRTLFERIVSLEGRLSLPNFLFDSYQTCFISLGLFSNTYLQLTPEGVYLVMSDKLGESPFTDRESFAMQRNLHTAERLKLDDVGRIQLPIRLLDKVGIKLGGWVIGEAGPRTSITPDGPAYWTLVDKQEWLKHHPSGQYTLDITNSTY